MLTAAGFLAAFTPGPASAAQPVPTRGFSAYSTGSLEHVSALQPGTTRVVNVDAPLSGASANSAGLGKAIQSETNAVVQPALAGKNSYARTGAAEVGLGTDVSQLTDQNQIILSKLVEASAPPSTDIVKDQLVEIPGDPLIYAKAAYEQASAKNICALGQPISYGENALANLQLIDAGAKNPDNSMSQPLISVTPTADPRTANFTKSYTYLFPNGLSPNGESTFGVAAVSHMTVAPITLFKGMGSNEVTIELLGTWTLRVEASGLSGGAKVTFNPEGNSGDIVLRVIVGGVVQGQLLLQDILGKAGVTIPANPLIQGTIATQPHAIGDDTKPAVATGDGTSASAAVDILKLQVLNAAPQLQGADLRIGHMEGSAKAASGGIDCPLPVSKTVDKTSVTAGPSPGGDVTYTITIPSSIADFADIACDLKDISAEDTASVDAPGPSMKLVSTDHNGNIDRPQVGPAVATTGHIKWANLGGYIKGSPPIVLTVHANVPSSSGAGKITNIVKVSASLTNCKGGALGQDFVGNALINGKAATINGSAFTGNASVAGLEIKPAEVKAALLATTGQKDPWLPVVGGGLLLGALALMRSRRRLHADQA
jgi:LPXTG-motif cell wall-anchored protein